MHDTPGTIATTLFVPSVPLAFEHHIQHLVQSASVVVGQEKMTNLIGCLITAQGQLQPGMVENICSKILGDAGANSEAVQSFLTYTIAMQEGERSVQSHTFRNISTLTVVMKVLEGASIDKTMKVAMQQAHALLGSVCLEVVHDVIVRGASDSEHVLKYAMEYVVSHLCKGGDAACLQQALDLLFSMDFLWERCKRAEKVVSLYHDAAVLCTSIARSTC